MFSRCLVTLALVALTAPALAQLPTVLYSDLVASPTSDVPGVAGAKFSSFDRPYVSQDGRFWAFTADTDLATSEDEVIVFGSGLTGTTIVREGTAAGWAAGENVGLLDAQLGVNNSGHITFATNTDGPTETDEYIVFWDGVNFTTAFQEGQKLPAPFGDEVYGATLDSGRLSNNGLITVRAPSTVGSLGTDFDDFLIYGANVLAQEGVTIPTGQLGGANEAWDLFDTYDFYVSADGNNWLAQGDLTGATTSDDVLVYNNNVVIQEDGLLPGFASPVALISECIMSQSGDWYARGDNDDDQDWLIRNGVVVAKTGDDVPGGLPGEKYSDAIYASTFFLMTGNSNGDYVIGATTDNPDVNRDAIIVLNGMEVLLREGDPVDLDGNGIFDDNTYIGVFNNDDAFLTDDGWFYFTADLRDVDLNALGQAFIRVLIPEPASLSLVLAGAVAFLRRR